MGLSIYLVACHYSLTALFSVVLLYVANKLSLSLSVCLSVCLSLSLSLSLLYGRVYNNDQDKRYCTAYIQNWRQVYRLKVCSHQARHHVAPQRILCEQAFSLTVINIAVVLQKIFISMVMLFCVL